MPDKMTPKEAARQIRMLLARIENMVHAVVGPDDVEWLEMARDVLEGYAALLRKWREDGK